MNGDDGAKLRRLNRDAKAEKVRLLMERATALENYGTVYSRLPLDFLEQPYVPKELPPMMNIRQRSVNVNRHDLLEKLRENREVHGLEYLEALREYRERLISDLEKATTWCQRSDLDSKHDVSTLLKFRFNVTPPQDHRTDYDDVIEMLEMSVDDVIELDAESFKAYFKNEWAWSRSFAITKSLYSTDGAFLA